MAGIFVSGLASGLAQLYRHFPPARRRQLVPVVALMLLSALTELMTIGAILPLFGAGRQSQSSVDESQRRHFPFAAFGWRIGTRCCCQQPSSSCRQRSPLGR